MQTVFTRIFIFIVVMSIAMGGSQAASARTLSAAEILQKQGLATYQWHGVSRPTTSATGAQFQALPRKGFKAVYLDLSDYLAVVDEAESAGKQARLAQLNLSLNRFVTGSSKLGLAVQAVGGSPKWTSASRRYLAAKLVRAVAEYNTKTSASGRLKGVQFDIEPYADPAFSKDTRTALVEYLKTLQSIVQEYRLQRTRPGNNGLQLGFAVPFWFDGAGQAPGSVSFNGRTKPTVFHLIDMLKELPDAYVVIMSYRNFTSGPDGSIAHAQSEFLYANSVRAKSGLVVGQEFGKVEPAKVTFYGLGPTAFKKASEEIAGAFGRFPQFRGIAVNDMESYATATR
jgi:hypothetical protein